MKKREHVSTLRYFPDKRKGRLDAAFDCSCGAGATFRWLRNEARVIEGGVHELAIPFSQTAEGGTEPLCPMLHGFLKRAKTWVGPIREPG